MDPVIDVQPATVPSPVAPITPAVPIAPAFDMDPLSHEDRQKEFAKGKLPQRLPKPEAKVAAPPAETPSAAAPSGASAGTETEPEPVDEETLTPGERRKRNANLRTESIRMSERLKLTTERAERLERELAEMRKPAPAAPKSLEAKAVSGEINDSMDISEAELAVLGEPPDPEKYEAGEMKKLLADTIVYANRLADLRFDKKFEFRYSAKTQAAKANDSWADQVKTAEAKYPDYQAVTAKVRVTPVINDEILKHKNGAEISYWMGLPENAADVTAFNEQTAIDDLNLERLNAACAKNPAMRDRVLIAKGIARAELNRIALKLANPPQKDPPPPAEITETKAPKPPKPIGGTGAAVVDPLAQALKEKNWTEVNRLRNEQAAAKRWGTR